MGKEFIAENIFRRHRVIFAVLGKQSRTLPVPSVHVHAIGCGKTEKRSSGADLKVRVESRQLI